MFTIFLRNIQWLWRTLQINKKNVLKQSVLMCALSLLALSRFAGAASMSCSGLSAVGGSYTVPAEGVKVVMPNASVRGESQLLYTVEKAVIGAKSVVFICDGLVDVGFTLTDIPAGTVYQQDGYTIYPTSVKGIGVSFTMTMPSAAAANYLPWPDATWYLRSFDAHDDPDYFAPGRIDTQLTIKIWRTPDYIYQSGGVEFTGPTFNLVVSASGAADTINTCPSERLNGKTCVYLSRKVVGTAQFISGTCEIVDTVQVVQMGKFNGNGEHSPWKDASFKLNCPNAYGMGSSVYNAKNAYNSNDGTVTSNTAKNSTVMIQVIPYTPIINTNQGVIALEPGGAEGYGIQLAWGKFNTQPARPTNAVRLNGRVTLYSANENFAMGEYDFGSNPLTTGADNTIPFSARYYRTTGNIVYGPANASVEILASYQ